MYKEFRNINKLYLIFGILTIICISLTIAYSILSISLRTTGTATVNSGKWDVHFSNLVTNNNGATIINEPAITTPTTITFNARFNYPGESIIILADIENKGTIDAMIESFTLSPTLTAKQKQSISYTLKYADDTPVTTNVLLKPNKRRKIEVKIKYRDDKDAIISEQTQNIDFSVKINFVQGIENGNYGPDNGGAPAKNPNVRVLKGTGYNILDEIALINEEFYVIDNKGKNLTLMGKYNLYVGGHLDTKGEAAFKENYKNYLEKMSAPTPLYPTNYTPYGSEATGLQDAGMTASYAEVNGAIPYAAENKHGPVLTDFNNSVPEHYMNIYKAILESYGIPIIEATIPTLDQLVALGCTYQNTPSEDGADVPAKPNRKYGNGSCYYAPAFVNSSSYWLKTKYDLDSNYKVWQLDQWEDLYTTMINEFNSGVRPIIVISKTLL